MAEGTLTETIRKIVAKAEPYVPQVPKPKRKLSLQHKLLWTGGALVIYLVMGQTPLFGATAPEFDFLAFARVLVAVILLLEPTLQLYETGSVFKL